MGKMVREISIPSTLMQHDDLMKEETVNSKCRGESGVCRGNSMKKSRTEIIDSQADSQGFNLLATSPGGGRVGHHRGFRDLQLHKLWAKAEFS